MGEGPQRNWVAYQEPRHQEWAAQWMEQCEDDPPWENGGVQPLVKPRPAKGATEIKLRAEREADIETLTLDPPGVTEASSEDEEEPATGSTFSPESELGSEDGDSCGGFQTTPGARGTSSKEAHKAKFAS